MNGSPWVLGIIFIVVGPFLALKGVFFAEKVVPVLAGLFGALFLMLLFAEFGWMEETLGIVLSIISALLIAGFCARLMQKHADFRHGFLGLLGGYFMGALLYTVLLACGWNNLWGMMAISICGAVVGCVLTIAFPEGAEEITMSGIGSYIFMRGCAYCFGGYPSER